MPKAEKCIECRAPMRRTGFEENNRGDTVFQYKCHRCEYRIKKTLTRRPTR